ncbi:RNA polymerase, sigma-24 subunit, ECF subfamily protein [Paenibacillus vortex V453]|uniref:RNA polymerase subunit sigma n=2 Tax=Paenibacillus TaxID=44249 RepID=A0A163LU88_9BACL|nr:MULTISPECIES: RNA polymerase sigma factor [Paenibacillus]ANA82401.1 RNA polymerase subunit sigma [Paenibacillus glucanolyticus]AVV58860.1 RNA polymerase sigma factor [Paenibacillus glucanolyticus]AWP28044.1 RNA polymerase subunit sigma [Paenibacillus sp. Cedars]EFU41086.1 RNA polymerase, sigma-24 subunit, ECF subfamily protein [Paenibacillus vortex V453]ETT41521.1 ECF subfamily RNA polymerase sigma-24 factor [Paenibacillus sp. FSL R5-808]
MQPTIPGEAEGKRNAIEAVIEQIQAGDKQSYHAIIIQFERQMYTYCYYILKNHAETEDAVQEIFIRAYEHLHQYKRQVSFSAWLYKMAYHHLINIKKKQSRFLNLIEHCKEQQPVMQISQHESVVYELLTYLTAEERHILLLKAVEQYTFEEISEIMGLKSATVRKKYERLRHKLMDRISQKGAVAHETVAGTNGIR